jgi:membrane associated rhomboid family serine protease
VAFAMIDPQRQLYLFPIPFPVTALALVLLVAVLNIISGLQENHVSVATHFGGMGVGFLYMKLLPQFNAWARDWRRNKQAKPKKNLDKIGEEVDNIFKFKDHDNRR